MRSLFMWLNTLNFYTHTKTFVLTSQMRLISHFAPLSLVKYYIRSWGV